MDDDITCTHKDIRRGDLTIPSATAGDFSHEIELECFEDTKQL
jgi:hypothetical protein